MTTNPLRLWLKSCGKEVTDSTVQETTHFMLDGGKLDLTKDYEIFQEMYAKYIKYKNCIVERKTDTFKLFVDLDILSLEVLDITEYIICIQNCISNIYSKDFMCIIATTDVNKTIRRDDTEYIKQGYHLHWPNIYVNKNVALQIRNNLVVSLTTYFGKVESMYDSWEKIVDRSVYEHNGLRLLGSDKCSYSDGSKEYENRVYIIHSVYNGNKYNEKNTNVYKTDTLKAVKDTSIRTNQTNVTEYKNLQEYEETVEENNYEKSGFTRVHKDSKEHQAIEKFFRNYITGYRIQDIRHILKVKDASMYIIDSKSKYCQNIQDFHTSNHIYFRLTPSGLCQKCRSEHEGTHGCCRDFNSSCIPITATLESILGWKKPKSKDESISKDFSVSNMCERMENNITGKDPFKGPKSKK